VRSHTDRWRHVAQGIVNTTEPGFRPFRLSTDFACADQIFSEQLRSTGETFAPGDARFIAVASIIRPQPDNTVLESPMNTRYLSAALMVAGLLVTAPAFAQTAPAQKQPTQEGGSTYPEHCSLAFNANPGADPDCKQRTQNLVPSPLQAAQESTGRK
jgi:hypothetical protein